jgi:putative transposase
VCQVLGLSRGNLLDKITRSPQWTDGRKSPPLADDDTLKTKRFAKQLGLKPVTTPITSPQSNGMAESFVKTFKRDYAKLAHRPDSQTVMGQLKAWFDDYNSFHPHSALGYLPPQLFRERKSAT